MALAWEAVPCTETFARTGAALHPETGVSLAQNVPAESVLMEPVSDAGFRMMSKDITCIGVHPTDQRLYGYRSAKLFRSDDFGRTWTQVYAFSETEGGGRELIRLWIFDAAGHEVWFCSGKEPTPMLKVSRDQGATWTETLPAYAGGQPQFVNDIILGGNHLYMAEYGARYYTGRAASASGIRCFRSSKTLAEIAAGQSWEWLCIYKPDLSGFYAAFNGGTTPAADSDGMHIHGLCYVPKEPGGARDVLYISYGDGNPSRNVVRKVGASQMAGVNSEPVSQNWVQGDVFTRSIQPVDMRLHDGQIYCGMDRSSGELLCFQAGPTFDPKPLQWDEYKRSRGQGLVLELSEQKHCILCTRHTHAGNLIYGVEAFPSYDKARHPKHRARVYRNQGAAATEGIFRMFSNPGGSVCGAYANRSQDLGALILRDLRLVERRAVFVGRAADNKIVTAEDFAGWTAFASGGASGVNNNPGSAGFGNARRLTTRVNAGAPVGSDGPKLQSPVITGFTAGDAYHFGVWIRPLRKLNASGGSSTTIDPSIVWQNGGGNVATHSMPLLQYDLMHTGAGPEDWIYIWFSNTIPATADRCQITLRLRFVDTNGTEVHWCLPQLFIGHAGERRPLVGGTARNVDDFRITIAESEWSVRRRGRVAAVFAPLAPTTVDRGAGTETLLSVEAHSGQRFALRWTYASGFTAYLYSSSGSLLASRALGSYLLEWDDRPVISLEWADEDGLILNLSTPCDGLQARFNEIGMARFLPKVVRWGGDLWDSVANPGYEGWYAPLEGGAGGGWANEEARGVSAAEMRKRFGERWTRVR